MISKEKFIKCMENEHKRMSRDNLYIVYKKIIPLILPSIDEDFQLQRERINSYINLLNQENLYIIKKEMIDDNYLKYFEYIYQINLEDKKKEVSQKFFKETGIMKNSNDVIRYIEVILHHLIPTNYYKIKQFNNKIKEILLNKKKNRGGIYGIYENGKLVYIGMTMRDFQVRWKEHMEGIQKKSEQLDFYRLINPKAQIKFKVLLDLSAMQSNSKITRRDLEAMEFALIQEHKPIYNKAGRETPYIFSLGEE